MPGEVTQSTLNRLPICASSASRAIWRASVARVASSALLATFFDLPLMFVYVVVDVVAVVAVLMLFALMFHLPHNLNIANIQTSLLIK